MPPASSFGVKKGYGHYSSAVMVQPVIGVMYVGKAEFEAVLHCRFSLQPLPSQLSSPFAVPAMRTALCHLVRITE